MYEGKKITISGGVPSRFKFLYERLGCGFSAIHFLSPHSLQGFGKKASKLIAFSRDKKIKRERFDKNIFSFWKKSLMSEHKLNSLPRTDHLVFHQFCLFAPFWHSVSAPYVLHLDFTMSLAWKMWPPWAPFSCRFERRVWFKFERQTYQRAEHIFSFSQMVKISLVSDYGVDPGKITVVGSSGLFDESYEGGKMLGSRQILFNTTDFFRKGGDIVHEAFCKVKRSYPETTLVVVGSVEEALKLREPGIEYTGYISCRNALRNIYLTSDILVHPARCEPYSHAVIEAMNYGVVPVTSSWGAFNEFIVSGSQGVVMERLCADELASHIIELFSQPERLKAMSAAARKKVSICLNWDYVAEKILKVIHSKIKL